ncbi:hypothetical protein CALVIDRAFT_568022 [Calocera viscosa TUFC12733]|uniref:Ribosomal protein S21 n=1 Tax=Calocera viscosa (strain TUFC12733) TaxID=1330018 RepID=A0A167HJM4_CALVF|nr:hypothetical protein CALVIDRAFT_568022 [Calocera viscosa TUFC12733]
MAHLLRQRVASSSRGFTHRISTSPTHHPTTSHRAFSTTRRARTDDDALSFPTSSTSQAHTVRPTSGRSGLSWSQPGLSNPFGPSARAPGSISFPASVPPEARDHLWNSVFEILDQGKQRRNVVKDPPETRWEKRSQTFLSFRGLDEVDSRFSGRSVEVEEGQVLKAYYQLSKIVSTNGIRTMWHRDQRFTPPSVMRATLKSVRHRRRYAEALKRKVQIVQKIRSIAR